MKNNLLLAIVAGVVTCILSAAIWAGVTIVTGYQIGWLAIGVGFFVGFGVRLLGQGDTPVFGFIGAIFAVLGCAIGNLLSIIGFLAEEESMGFMDAVLGFDYSLSVEILTATFQPMDVLFYGLALYAGYRYSIVGE